jgi:hypothetical protein
MPMRCTVCQHPERRAIDKALAIGQEAKRTIAHRYGLGYYAVLRHEDEHLPARLAKAQADMDVRAALDVVRQLKAINGAALQVLADARRVGNGELALKAIDRIQRQVELQAKLLGELDERPQINLLVAPEWLRTRTVLLEALAPYPEARFAVADRLRALGAG